MAVMVDCISQHALSQVGLVKWLPWWMKLPRMPCHRQDYKDGQYNGGRFPGRGRVRQPLTTGFPVFQPASGPREVARSRGGSRKLPRGWRCPMSPSPQPLSMWEQCHPCPKCGKSFLTTSALQMDWRNHSGEKPFQCRACGLQFSLSYSLIKHEALHMGERPYRCPDCSQFLSQSNSIMHRCMAHACTKSVTGGSNVLERGARTVDRLHLCHQCGKSFISRSNLQVHCLSHGGARANKCPQCEKSFIRLSKLIRHQRMHTGERPFTYHVCLTYHENSRLAQHRRVHMP